MTLNNAVISHVEVQPILHKGHGLIAQDNPDDFGQSPLISVPHDLVLNSEAVEQYAKVDQNFKILLDACGHKVSQSPSRCPTQTSPPHQGDRPNPPRRK